MILRKRQNEEVSRQPSSRSQRVKTIPKPIPMLKPIPIPERTRGVKELEHY